ncbi:hypothetical protein AcV7_005017 [Taiwanofungus camphoratus]|nr:hypothetical protein AcV7_005017 [Antrodia cinnamomea]
MRHGRDRNRAASHPRARDVTGHRVTPKERALPLPTAMMRGDGASTHAGAPAPARPLTRQRRDGQSGAAGQRGRGRFGSRPTHVPTSPRHHDVSDVGSETGRRGRRSVRRGRWAATSPVAAAVALARALRRTRRPRRTLAVSSDGRVGVTVASTGWGRRLRSGSDLGEPDWQARVSDENAEEQAGAVTLAICLG